MRPVYRLIALILVSFVVHANATKIGFVGNSITQGTGLTNPELDSYPGQLAVFLPDSFEVSNFGLHSRTLLKKGDYPYWDIEEFQQALAFDADILFIMLGTNDSKPQNWDAYGNEFYDDFIALIDTLSAGTKVPEFWICLPPPAFSVQWDIRDSVIVNGIIPILKQIIAERGFNSIDFYTAFLDKRDLFQDDIHPTSEGAEEMASMIYEALLGKSIEKVQDVNVAKHKTVTVSQDAGDTGARLVDGDPLSYWAVPELPASAVFDLEEADSVDAFAVHFPSSSEAGIQYTIETSLDGQDWTLVVDETGREATDQVAGTHVTVPLAVRYIRLTLTGVVSESEPIAINEFQALKYTGSHHACVLSAKLDRVTSSNRYYYVHFTPVNGDGEVFKIFRDLGDGFVRFPGYESTDYTGYRTLVRDGQEPTFYNVSYSDGVLVASDSIHISYLDSGVEEQGSVVIPGTMTLYANYPNPFNPETVIEYALNQPGKVRLTIFNSLGQEVVVLDQGHQTVGMHRARFDGRQVESGVYIYRLELNGSTLERKMLLMK